ncbi:MAG: ATP phosphoribosyltransferase [Anaerolineae bacterium]|nr:ATP phosphoribosyltransferase [Anaerolineae bacterium]
MDESQVRLSLPSKGRMEEETKAFLDECGMRIEITNPRQYFARIPALPQVQVLFQRARDIARSVEAGDVDLAITGFDIIVDTLGEDHPELVVIHEALGYSHCKLALAVPYEWDDVSDMKSLGERASRSPEGLRVATRYVNATRGYLDRHGLSQIRIVSADGALEAAPSIGYAELIADITSTGTTLRENLLKLLDGGTIVESQAVLVGNRKALESRPAVRETTRQLLEFIEAHLRARGQYLVFANMRGESKDEIARRIFEQPNLGGLQGPTISQVLTRDGDSGWWAINLVIAHDKLYDCVRQVRAAGGSGVVITPVVYIFEEYPERFRRLLDNLGLQEELGE